MYKSGWANNCGVELFTHGWVKCQSVVVEITPDEYYPSGGYLERKLPDQDIDEQIARDDMDILALVMAAIDAGIIE